MTTARQILHAYPGREYPNLNLVPSHAGQAAEQIAAYLLFYGCTISLAAAKVNFAFHDDETSDQKKVQVAALKFRKAGDTRNLARTKIEGRAS